MKFRCPRCDALFSASPTAGGASCPGCGQQLSVKPRLRKTCPACGGQYRVERTACPECGANYRVAGLRQQEGDAAEPYAPEVMSPGMRGCLLVVGIACTAAGLFLCKKAWDGGRIVWLFLALVVMGLGGIGHALFTSNAAAKAREARKAQRERHQGPSQ
jgi:DNA-directed RNA polymerase subunit RPC12/RpoP